MERISVFCTECGGEIHILPTQLGREIRCLHCKHITVLRTSESAESVAEPVREEPDIVRPKTQPSPPRRLPRENGEEAESVKPMYGRKLYKEESADLTTMVDVTFLLLIFFMVTAAFALQRSLEVPPPNSESQSKEDQIQQDPDDNAVIVRIQRDNSVYVEDQEVPSRQELLAVLRNLVRPHDETPPVSTMQVISDGRATYETVVMVLDSGNAVGMKNIQLKTEDQDQ